jgi:phospholipid-binding lipoprotein MlaA
MTAVNGTFSVSADDCGVWGWLATERDASWRAPRVLGPEIRDKKSNNGFCPSMKLPCFMGRSARLVGAMAVMLSVTACVVQDTPEKVAQVEETNDPFEPTNRYLFEVNRFLDEMLLKPVAWWYRIGVPDPARERIHLALANLRLPWTAVNDLIQGEMNRAYESGARFVINSTVGVVGLFDVATDWGYRHHEEDAGQTFAVWGSPEGPYLMLPVFGPSNPRDAVGLAVDYIADPVNIILRHNGADVPGIVRGAATAVDSRERNIETIADLERNSVDFYATIRSIYRQRRAAEIRNGAPDGNYPAPSLSKQN